MAIAAPLVGDARAVSAAAALCSQLELCCAGQQSDESGWRLREMYCGHPSVRFAFATVDLSRFDEPSRLTAFLAFSAVIDGEDWISGSWHELAAMEVRIPHVIADIAQQVPWSVFINYCQRESICELVFCGHGRSAAVAQLGTLDALSWLRESLSPNVICYTFGAVSQIQSLPLRARRGASTAAGDATAARDRGARLKNLLSTRMVNYVHETDAVPAMLSQLLTHKSAGAKRPLARRTFATELCKVMLASLSTEELRSEIAAEERREAEQSAASAAARRQGLWDAVLRAWPSSSASEEASAVSLLDLPALREQLALLQPRLAQPSRHPTSLQHAIISAPLPMSSPASSHAALPGRAVRASEKPKELPFNTVILFAPGSTLPRSEAGTDAISPSPRATTSLLGAMLLHHIDSYVSALEQVVDQSDDEWRKGGLEELPLESESSGCGRRKRPLLHPRVDRATILVQPCGVRVCLDGANVAMIRSVCIAAEKGARVANADGSSDESAALVVVPKRRALCEGETCCDRMDFSSNVRADGGAGGDNLSAERLRLLSAIAESRRATLLSVQTFSDDGRGQSGCERARCDVVVAPDWRPQRESGQALVDRGAVPVGMLDAALLRRAYSHALACARAAHLTSAAARRQWLRKNSIVQALESIEREWMCALTAASGQRHGLDADGEELEDMDAVCAYECDDGSLSALFHAHAFGRSACDEDEEENEEEDEDETPAAAVSVVGATDELRRLAEDRLSRMADAANGVLLLTTTKQRLAMQAGATVCGGLVYYFTPANSVFAYVAKTALSSATTATVGGASTRPEPGGEKSGWIGSLRAQVTGASSYLDTIRAAYAFLGEDTPVRPLSDGDSSSDCPGKHAGGGEAEAVESAIEQSLRRSAILWRECTPGDGFVARRGRPHVRAPHELGGGSGGTSDMSLWRPSQLSPLLLNCAANEFHALTSESRMYVAKALLLAVNVRRLRRELSGSVSVRFHSACGEGPATVRILWPKWWSAVKSGLDGGRVGALSGGADGSVVCGDNPAVLLRLSGDAIADEYFDDKEEPDECARGGHGYSECRPRLCCGASVGICVVSSERLWDERVRSSVQRVVSATDRSIVVVLSRGAVCEQRSDLAQALGVELDRILLLSPSDSDEHGHNGDELGTAGGWQAPLVHRLHAWLSRTTKELSGGDVDLARRWCTALVHRDGAANEQKNTTVT